MCGSKGKLGKEILNLAQNQGFSVVELGRQHWENSVKPELNLLTPHVVIDVSGSAGTQSLATFLSQLPETDKTHLKGVIVGSTGHTPLQLEEIKNHLKKWPVVWTPNLSKGITLLKILLQTKLANGKVFSQLARELGFDFGVLESHHIHKKDAPSGTGILLSKLIGLDENQVGSSRVGHVVGEHEILISGKGELMKISHSAHDRGIFAQGALDLTLKLLSDTPRQAGNYTIEEIYMSHGV
jgi:dihydrodipicolinate reductase